MVFLVTGGSRGLGASIVAEAAAQGHDVAFTYRTDEDAAAQVLATVQRRAPDVRCRIYQLDVGDSEQVDSVTDRVVAEFDTVDVLVANAGVNRDNLLVSMTNEEWDAVLRTNLTGSFYLCRAVLGTMLANRFGRILLVSSIVHTGASGQGNYCASKAGLHGLAGTIAREYGRRGITANVLVPGFFDTPMTRDTMPQVNKDFWLQYCPVGRMGDLSEIGKTVVFLASEGAGFITGQIVPLTGGLDWAP